MFSVVHICNFPWYTHLSYFSPDNNSLDVDLLVAIIILLILLAYKITTTTATTEYYLSLNECFSITSTESDFIDPSNLSTKNR